MKDEKTNEEKRSFIAAARREQIMEAAIATLDEIGFVRASLEQIAKRAGISTALISYHFKDRNDLMDCLLMNLLENTASYILERVSKEKDPHAKLETFTLASLAYQGTHNARNTALIEIIFNARTEGNIPYYKLNDEEEGVDEVMQELRRILMEGQQQGVFGNFNADVMANLIQGSIGEYMFNTDVTKKVDLETYGSELVSIINKAVSK